MSRHVMVPLDGSRFAETAIPAALRLTEATGCCLELVMVQELGPVFAMEAWEAAYPEAARTYLNDVVARLSNGSQRDIKTTVLVGRPASELDERSRESTADLIVMATHGRGPLSRVWLGSVADELMRHTRTPILLVRPEDKDKVDLTDRPSFQHVLVPLDGSERAEAVVAQAVTLARGPEGQYTLLRVVRYPDELVSAYVPGTIQMSQQVVDEGIREANIYLDGIATRMRQDGLEVETRVLVDSRPASAILSYADDHEVDLIAMATHGRGGVPRAVMGSVTDKVVRGAHRPVLVVRPAEEAES
jgi:nucleotide-binding universal stress UspA family protein